MNLKKIMMLIVLSLSLVLLAGCGGDKKPVEETKKETEEVKKEEVKDKK